MNTLRANMKLIVECAEKLAHLGENLWGNEQKLDKAEPLDVPTMTTDFVKEHGLPCPEGHVFKDENGNIINATKIVLEKKEKEYPKTYEECCKVIDYALEGETIIGYKASLLRSLQKLLICRDAYWKIAGDWKPDYDSGVDKFSICTYDGVVQKSNAVSHWERHLNKVLAFPTEEMRDAFYENFKELIESVKELL